MSRQAGVGQDLAGGEWPHGRVGYVAILGRPNVGKSTLLNTLLDVHLAPVSNRPQTTRKRLLGVHTDTGVQLLFLDCPGFHEGSDALDELMQKTVLRSVRDADVILCMADPTRKPRREDAAVAATAAKTGRPVVLALNKIDQAEEDAVDRTETFYKERLGPAPTVRICALDRDSLAPLVSELARHLPEGPFLFEPDFLTDSPEREIGAELIREAALELLEDEVPHATAVVIDLWEEHPDRRVVHASLYVERPSQKAIVIGRKGRMLAAIRTKAEEKLTEITGCPVRLHLWVKVAPRWRKKRRWIQEFDIVGRLPSGRR